MIKYFCFLWLLMFQLALYAQDREVLYTLKDGEVIAESENSLGVYQGRLGYIAVIQNELYGTRKYLVNRSEIGPFQGKSYQSPVLESEHWGLVDTREDSTFVVFDGYKKVAYNSTKHAFDMRVSKKLMAYLIYNELLADYELVVNGFKYGPYTNLMQYYLSPDGSNWAIMYYEVIGSEYDFFLKFTNDKVLGPFKKINDFAMLNSGQFVAVCEKRESQGKATIITEKGELGTFDRELTGKDYSKFLKIEHTPVNYAMNVIKNGKIYFLVNGNLLGPYNDFVEKSDLGVLPDRFNYVVGKENTLYFKANLPFTKYVKRFTVSESRNSMAILKESDSLNVNEKYFVGYFKGIEDFAFVPGTEDFYIWINNGTTYDLKMYINGKLEDYGNFSLKSENGKLPYVNISISGKHWGMVYLNDKSEHKVVVDGKEYESGLVKRVAIYKEADGKEVASWIALEGQELVLQKIVFE
jgi:hypothetical protein